MKYLMIDTSTNLMVLVLKNGSKLDYLYRSGKSDHQAYIIPLIDELLKRNDLTVKDLTGVIIGIGPGSYTGLRVGLTTAKMLAYSLKIPLYKVSSLLFLTSGYSNYVFAWHDARNNYGFSGGFLKGKSVTEEKLRLIDDVTLEDKNSLLVINNETIKVDGNVIFDAKELVEDVKGITPNYLRKTEAEVKLDQKN